MEHILTMANLKLKPFLLKPRPTNQRESVALDILFFTCKMRNLQLGNYKKKKKKTSEKKKKKKLHAF